MNLFTTATLRQKKLTVVERFEKESMYGMGRCREEAISGSDVRL